MYAIRSYYDSEYLNEFLDAGCCDPEVTEKICRYLEIEVHNA